MNLEQSLKVCFSSLVILNVKSHLIHFNLEGKLFFPLHLLTEKIYQKYDDERDNLGEQLRSCDIYTPLSMSEILSLSVINDAPLPLSATGMMHELLLDHEHFIDVLNEANKLAANHPGVQTYIQQLIQDVSKFTWFIHATLKGK